MPLPKPRHLGARRADAEAGAADAAPLLPRLVEPLRLAGQHPVDHDVLGAGDVPHQPRQRVQVLARADAHLRLGQAGERPLGRRHLVAGHGGRVHCGVLVQEQITSVHVMVLLWSWVEGYRTRAPALVAVIIMIAWADADGTCDAAARQAAAAQDKEAECRIIATA